MCSRMRDTDQPTHCRRVIVWVGGWAGGCGGVCAYTWVGGASSALLWGVRAPTACSQPCISLTCIEAVMRNVVANPKCSMRYPPTAALPLQPKPHTLSWWNNRQSTREGWGMYLNGEDRAAQGCLQGVHTWVAKATLIAAPLREVAQAGGGAKQATQRPSMPRTACWLL